MKKVPKMIGVVLGVVILLIAALVFLTSVPRSTKGLQDIADRFQPDQSWQFVDESIRPPMYICLGGKCDHLARTWSTTHITQEAFERVISQSGFHSVKLERDCDLSRDSSVRCYAYGIVDEYRVIVYANAPQDNPEEVTIRLSVQG